jgi:putative two-component system response regulator
VVKLLRAMLEIEGYRILEASDGDLGLEELRRSQPDLVITDLRMPRVSGFEVCRRIKEDPATRLIPVVMLTAHGDSDSKLQGIDLGADDFINKPFNKAELLARVRSLLRTKFLTDQLENAHSVLMTMARVVEAKDRFTWGHTERVSRMAVELGQAAGLPEEDLDALHKGGILHDTGKIEVPDSILNKEGPLDDEEWLIMKRHPVAGEEIVRPLHSLAHVVPLILHHHEKLDGSGYPHGLRGQEIPTVVRILSVVDVYDALTHRRSYKPALPRDRALEILEEEAARGWWDRDIVGLFKQQRSREETL